MQMKHFILPAASVAAAIIGSGASAIMSEAACLYKLCKLHTCTEQQDYEHS